TGCLDRFNQFLVFPRVHRGPLDRLLIREHRQQFRPDETAEAFGFDRCVNGRYVEDLGGFGQANGVVLEHKKLVEAVKATGRKKLIIAALWTEVCLNFPTLDALAEGYEVYIVTDASGGTTKEAHDMSVQRMIQAGAVPVTWQQVLLEFQRDWAHKETYEAVMELVLEHSGAYGMGVDYAYTMVHGAPQRKLG
nr:isochorismatase hydrolase [Tanacetum cinerariifolium]